MTTAPPALPGRTWNKRLKESRELACLLLGMADMRVDDYAVSAKIHTGEVATEYAVLADLVSTPLLRF
jgi:hypothetical protein